MSLHRFFLTAPLSDDAERALPLSESDTRHAAGALRVSAGELIEVVEPGGSVWRVRVTDATTHAIHAELVEQVARRAVCEPHVTLFQGVAKGEKMDDIARQAVEVGAERIVPVFTERTVVKLVGRKAVERAERWRRIAESAAKQSHCDRVPEVDDPVDLSRSRAMLAEFDCVLVLWEEQEAGSPRDALAECAAGPDARVALVVGPEGGLSAEEVAALRADGAHVVSLGARILRTETAAVVGLALTLAALGGLGSDRP